MKKTDHPHKITWVKSSSDIEFPTRNGLALCSTKNPVNEAQRWISGLPASVLNSTALLIIGLGAGFHIDALEGKRPGIKITVLEADLELKNRFYQRSPQSKVEVKVISEDFSITEQEVLSEYDAILSFQPSWQGADLIFQATEAQLLGSNSARQYLDFKVENSEVKTEIWSILGELVR